MSQLRDYQEKYFLPFLNELELFVSGLLKTDHPELKEIFRYHLGLDDDPIKQGKRIRPIFTLLCTEGGGGDWKTAVPAAIAIELIHNFSLIHDDIEDNGLYRRSKETVWVKWGLPKGLNAGDAMFSSAFAAICNLKNYLPSEIVVEAVELLSSVCLKLTSGQQLDIDFENHEKVRIQEYYEMISGKTAALLACCAEMGALIAGLDKEEQIKYHQFGIELGMAFQMYDDWLGIWGDPKITGKSASSDLLEGKKSLPILLGMENSKRFFEKWESKSITTDNAAELATWLREDGIEDLVMEQFNLWNQKGLRSLAALKCDNGIRLVLNELAEKLLTRNK